MSRSGYSDDLDQWDLIRWRGAVTSAIRGARGQAFMREMLAALDAMPEKRLIRHELENGGGVCALGAVGRARGIDQTTLDPENQRQIAEAFGIARAMTCEIVFENDEVGWQETPEQRWMRVRAWVAAQVKP